MDPTAADETPPIPPETRAAIADRLAAVETARNVRILFAAESGSRAWGFPSPDSDFDVRFVYVHPPDWYLSIETRRDVLELPIADGLDINGWDLRKALALLIKPNPVLLEWLRSPIIYRAEAGIMDRLSALAARTDAVRPSAYHYRHLAGSQYRRFILDRDQVSLKKYLYCLRPALALRWLRTGPSGPLPMALGAIRAGITLPEPVDTELSALLARKRQTRELGEAPRVAAFDRFIEEELAQAETITAAAGPPPERLLDDANRLFRSVVKNQCST